MFKYIGANASCSEYLLCGQSLSGVLLFIDLTFDSLGASDTDDLGNEFFRRIYFI